VLRAPALSVAAAVAAAFRTCRRLRAWQRHETVLRLASSRIIAVAGLSAIAMAASGCSGDSAVETRPPTQSTVDIAKFRAAFKEAFGTPPDERPWYGLITGMKIASRDIVTETASYRVLDVTTRVERLSDTVVHEICEAVFTVDSETRIGIEAVRVIDSDGEDGGCA
jgi:hypothetical protein